MSIQLQERELTELFKQIYTPTLQDKFTELFPYRYDPIIGVGSLDGTRVSWITAQKYLTNEELIINWRNPNKFVGVTFGKNTKYALIDIDVDSQYHPHYQIIKVEDALTKVGINQVNWYKSSGSEGWHGYIPFNKEISTWTVAVVLTQALTTAGFEIAKGQLEIFPNTKSWNSKYNSHRLPLQAGFESNKDELNWFLLDWEEAANSNDADLFESYSEEARSWFKSRKLSNNQFNNKSGFTAKGQKSTNWYNNLQATLKEGWTAKSQTNDILGDIAALHRIFTKASSVEELASMVIETATTLPGYQQFCNHQKEIVKRCTEWARCAWKKYRPLGSLNQKTYVKKTEEENKNLIKLKEIRAKIAEALVNLKESGVKVTYRLLAKEAGVSINSISKHKDLLTLNGLTSVSPLEEAAVSECSEVEEPNKELTVSPHLIVKRYDTRFKVKTPSTRLKIRVKGLEVNYSTQLNKKDPVSYLFTIKWGDTG